MNQQISEVTIIKQIMSSKESKGGRSEAHTSPKAVPAAEPAKRSFIPFLRIDKTTSAVRYVHT
jgi:hypothetical protein